MLNYDFYKNDYFGDSVSENAFPRLARDAEAQLARFKRIYQVSGDETAENMAVCAMLDAAYYYEQALNGQIATSVSVGSVSSTAQQTAAVDVSPEVQQREYLRCAEKYLDVYRGC